MLELCWDHTKIKNKQNGTRQEKRNHRIIEEMGKRVKTDVEIKNVECIIKGLNKGKIYESDKWITRQ